jgi:hypothetical protein
VYVYYEPDRITDDIQNAILSLVLAFNQLINPWALEVMGWKYVCPIPFNYPYIELTSMGTVFGVLQLATCRADIHLQVRH